MDLIGIENEAEFFPAGALSDALEDELRQITSQWSKGIAAENPSLRLTLCAESYLLSVRQIRNTPDRKRRQELRQKATHYLITALGYEYSRLSLPTAVDGEPLVPLLARATNEEGRDVVWTLRANKRETFDWLKFTLEGEGERTHGYAFTDTAFARYRV